ncbi:nuclear transcription factor Y subunit gamma-like isoform X2 [Halichondria panicea]|uniref:nuclear transcription factor Y subunit gamma-like isoform X2 n=2 Tax=Halichondria panicea TaxID=6063 RepID=UPI00312B6FD3
MDPQEQAVSDSPLLPLVPQATPLLFPPPPSESSMMTGMTSQPVVLQNQAALITPTQVPPTTYFTHTSSQSELPTHDVLQSQAALMTSTQSGLSTHADGSVFISVPVAALPSTLPSPIPITTKLDTFWTDQLSCVQHVSDDHWKTPEFPLARIKKIMRMDEDVRMISAEVPVMFSKAVDVFISELSIRAWHITEESKRRTIQCSDIAMAITNNDMYDFLIDIVPREEIQMKQSKPQSGESLQLLPPDLLQLYIQHFAATASGEEDTSVLQNQLQILQQLLQIQQLQEQQEQVPTHPTTLTHTHAHTHTTQGQPPSPPTAMSGITSTGSILDTQVLQTSDTREITHEVLEQLRQHVASGNYDSGLLEGAYQSPMDHTEGEAAVLGPEYQSPMDHTEGEAGVLGPEFVEPAMDIDSLTHQVLHSVHPMSMASDTPIVHVPAEFGLEEPTHPPAMVAFSSTPLRLTHIHGGSSLVQLTNPNSNQ